MNKNIDVSIIVPVYKAEKYLNKCVDSILRQTFKNFELILIDDGSPDNSGKICDEYAKKDNRVKVFHQVNKGVSSARNLGLDNASGTWITFVDSDDWVADDYIQNFFDIINTQSNISIVVSGSVKIFGESKQPIIFTNERLSFYDALKKGQIIRFGCVWGKFFKKAIIEKKHIRFLKNISFSEDLIFFLGYLRSCKDIYYSNSSSYFYNRQTTGLSLKYTSYEEDRLILDEVIKGTNILMKDEKLPNNVLSDILKIFYRRTITSIYRSQFKRTQRQRIKILKDLNNTYPILTKNSQYLFLRKNFIFIFDISFNILFYLRDGILKKAWQLYINYKNGR